ncbi:MAG: hypothetical protein KJ728_06705 [Alphaproteobacteria bacterium]|uniref:hypothetical protein n=1 Tax=Brevundimonas sp. TaxID=1871086 RepID=UPI001D2F884D|nr:hypothetical protein [Alphaproteobacteria bacterium]MBU1521096.1 hypothetical protein [Alphaproteobacteria bacterium]MBU2030486.1 hypothetical protein [Alphaproteobacteria bacterium]MBU2165654.1 hypothetical protein [Alphaproteobacteria bacterium]MBU2231388.1 hypothetical protein [Alphaproteobacteria bacterium]
MSSVEDPKMSWPVRIGGLFFLGLAGAGVGYLVGGRMEVEDLRWDDALALVIAAMLLMTGVILAAMAAMRSSKLPPACGPLQALVMLIAGGLMVAPIWGPNLASPDVVFIGLVLLSLVQSVANLMLWCHADEMLRRVMVETSALAFWASQMALFLYAAAERLGLTGGVSAWGMMAVLMTIYLLASAVASMRRGLH